MQKISIYLNKLLRKIADIICINSNLANELARARESEVKLLQRNHFLQHILDAATTRIWHFDKEVRVVSLNKAAQENLEYPLEEYIGKTTFDYFHNMDDARFYHELDMQVINSGRPDLGRLDVYEAPDGNTYYKKVDRIPYYDEDGDIAGITVYSYDISEQKWAENDLREQRLILEKEIQRRIAAEEELRRLATTDPLTGIYNRRHFFELANKELIRTKRTKKPFSIILYDIDHFKRINDTFGHLAGDKVLKNLSTACQKNLREMDVLARYGGEEFIILLPELGIPNSTVVAEKIRKIIAGQALSFENRSISVTASLGVATHSVETEPLDKLLARVDKALYEAKEMGRNQVMVG